MAKQLARVIDASTLGGIGRRRSIDVFAANALYGLVVSLAVGELATQRHTPSVRARLRRTG